MPNLADADYDALFAIMEDDLHGIWWKVFPNSRAAKTAKLVATVSWSWSFGHSRCDRYLIGSDRNRMAWTLWATANDFDGRGVYALFASGTPCRGYTARSAAEQLLTASWSCELEMGSMRFERRFRRR